MAVLVTLLLSSKIRTLLLLAQLIGLFHCLQNLVLDLELEQEPNHFGDNEQKLILQASRSRNFFLS
jgi:hypothetical protein